MPPLLTHPAPALSSPLRSVTLAAHLPAQHPSSADPISSPTLQGEPLHRSVHRQGDWAHTCGRLPARSGAEGYSSGYGWDRIIPRFPNRPTGRRDAPSPGAPTAILARGPRALLRRADADGAPHTRRVASEGAHAAVGCHRGTRACVTPRIRGICIGVWESERGVAGATADRLNHPQSIAATNVPSTRPAWSKTAILHRPSHAAP
jgi:hypothetical protein